MAALQSRWRALRALGRSSFPIFPAEAAANGAWIKAAHTTCCVSLQMKKFFSSSPCPTSSCKGLPWDTAWEESVRKTFGQLRVLYKQGLCSKHQSKTECCSQSKVRRQHPTSTRAAGSWENLYKHIIPSITRSSLQSAKQKAEHGRCARWLRDK